MSGPDAPRVLVVEDDESNQVLAQRIMASAGITDVRFADDAGTVPDTVVTFDPDLVLLDLNLRGTSGFDLMRTLAACDPCWEWRNVLLVTGDTSAAVDSEASRTGARGVLRKPYRVDQFLDAIGPLVEAGLASRSERARLAGSAE